MNLYASWSSRITPTSLTSFGLVLTRKTILTTQMEECSSKSSFLTTVWTRPASNYF